MEERRWGWGGGKEGKGEIEEGREKEQAEREREEKKRKLEKDKEEACVQWIYQTVNLERERTLSSFFFIKHSLEVKCTLVFKTLRHISPGGTFQVPLHAKVDTMVPSSEEKAQSCPRSCVFRPSAPGRSYQM